MFGVAFKYWFAKHADDDTIVDDDDGGGDDDSDDLHNNRLKILYIGRVEHV